MRIVVVVVGLRNGRHEAKVRILVGLSDRCGGAK
jgi:hypothetical protein